MEFEKLKKDVYKRQTVYLVTGNQCCFVPEMDVWIWQYEQTRTVGFSFPQLPVCRCV